MRFYKYIHWLITFINSLVYCNNTVVIFSSFSTWPHLNGFPLLITPSTHNGRLTSTTPENNRNAHVKTCMHVNSTSSKNTYTDWNTETLPPKVNDDIPPVEDNKYSNMLNGVRKFFSFACCYIHTYFFNRPCNYHGNATFYIFLSVAIFL